MSQTPDPPSGSPSGQPPWGAPPHPPSGPGSAPGPGRPGGMSNRAKFWSGFFLAIPAMVVGAVLTSLPSFALGSLGADPAVGGVVGLVVGLAELAGLVALIVVPRTRWWGIGLLAGIAASFIVLAGACVVLLVALSNASYG